MREQECYWLRCLRCDRVASTTHRPTFCHACGGAVIVVTVSASTQARLQRQAADDLSSGSFRRPVAP